MKDQCPSCIALSTVVDRLLKEIGQQHRLLMAFNKAGYSLAQQEVEMAKLSIEKQQAETVLVRARAASMQAEADKTRILDGGPKPIHGIGSGSHERVIVGG